MQRIPGDPLADQGKDGLWFWTARQGEALSQAGPTTKKARADGVVGFLSRQRATRHRELRGTGVEEAAPGQPKSLGTDAFTASLLTEPRELRRKLGVVGEARW